MYMGVKIKDSVRDPKYIKKLVDKRLKESLEIMADDIYKRAKELEPPQPVKDSFADKMRKIIGNKDD